MVTLSFFLFFVFLFLKNIQNQSVARNVIQLNTKKHKPKRTSSSTCQVNGNKTTHKNIRHIDLIFHVQKVRVQMHISARYEVSMVSRRGGVDLVGGR